MPIKDRLYNLKKKEDELKAIAKKAKEDNQREISEFKEKADKLFADVIKPTIKKIIEHFNSSGLEGVKASHTQDYAIYTPEKSRNEDYLSVHCKCAIMQINIHQINDQKLFTINVYKKPIIKSNYDASKENGHTHLSLNEMTASKFEDLIMDNFEKMYHGCNTTRS